MRTRFAFLFFVLTSFAQAQVRQFPLTENFDRVIVPALPPGWLTTSNRISAGDFITTHSVPLSDSSAVISTNAVAAQSLSTPILDFSNKQADSILFYERRSASHNSGVLVEASTDGGATFAIQIGDTLKNAGVTSYVARRMQLPATLSNQSAVRIRWQVLADGTGTSGTIRFDDVTITAKVQIDAAVTAISWLPQFPRAGDSIFVRATMKNAGTSAIQDITADFYKDDNTDSLPQEAERFGTTHVDHPLQTGDTVLVQSLLLSPVPGATIIIVVARSTGDQNPANDLLLGMVKVGFAEYSLIINEIMYQPLTGDPEYVELLNRSDRPVDLLDWKLSDVADPAARGSSYLLTAVPLKIDPGEYFVEASDSSLFRRFTYLADPSHHVVIKGGSLSLNNSGDDLILTDFLGNTIDSVHYLAVWHNAEIDDPSARSLERINPNLPGNDRRNWSTCANPLGGTPGRRNSLYETSAPSPASVSFSPNPFSPDGDPFGAFLPNHSHCSKTTRFMLSTGIEHSRRSYQKEAAGPENDSSGSSGSAGCAPG